MEKQSARLTRSGKFVLYDFSGLEHEEQNERLLR
jgi:hypothetical protein